MSEHDGDFEAAIRRALDGEVERLDRASRARLRQARRRAVEAAEAEAGERYFRRWWIPAGAVVALSLLVVVLWSPQRELAAPALGPGDFELLTNQDPLELYRDLDFYQWLAQEREHAG